MLSSFLPSVTERKLKEIDAEEVDSTDVHVEENEPQSCARGV